ncbi:FAD-dependent oxidoreductase [Paenibacillus thalictri]|uniref:FAD-dependent oxidoreductase n=1 Tax=Paenibacillus thalictri TaxID=2527873 RepID=A0A4Q9DZH4_9BACL|nr:FAD-dependent oxidoreductase [Paenibacillus thalictri]TBL80681.1 FAD-dependent oxidoreductase [Paenibacillus thalictri]
MIPAKEQLSADVLVVGGGTAGCNAAIAAAQEGASVIVVEMDAAVGGVATRSNISSYHYGSRGGLQDLVDKKVMARQAVFGGRDSLSHPEAKRSVYSEMLKEHGVRVLLRHTAFDVWVEDGQVAGVVAAGPAGVVDIRAKVTIDCSADGDIAAAAGANFTVGREFDGICHLYSLTPRTVAKHPRTGKLQLGQLNFDAGWVHSSSVLDVSAAYMEGRAHLAKYLTEGPGSGQHLLSAAPKLGVREGRHITGDYVMNMDDFLYDRHFDDVVSRACSHYDTHAKDLGNESDFAQIWLVVLDMFVKGSYWCDIPYRSLLPKGVSGMLVASRALSVDREVSMGVRMQRDMQKVGEAAGVAAAISAARGLEPRQLPVAELQRRLVERGVLKPHDLTRTETANLTFQHGELAGVPISREYLCKMSPAEAERLAQKLAAYIGAKEEGFAIWWLVQLGKPAEAPLLGLMNGKGEYACRRSAAFALGLLGSETAVPFLLRMLRSREDDRPQHLKPYPKWVAAVIVLRLLRCKDAYTDVLAALEENHSASFNTLLLQYLYERCGELSREQQLDLTERLQRWFECPGVGGDYTAQGDLVTTSIRWNMASWVGLIMAAAGHPGGIELCRPYLNDPRQYVRLAIAAGIERMKIHLAEHTEKGCAAR